MSGEDIKRLREELSCSIGELAKAVGVDVRTVVAWESGDLFPTKRHSARLEALRKAGPTARRRASGNGGRPAGEKPNLRGLELLADPKLWAVVRKLLAHPELFRAVERLADEYPDLAAR